MRYSRDLLTADFVVDSCCPTRELSNYFVESVCHRGTTNQQSCGGMAQEAVVALSFLAYQRALDCGYSTARCARRTPNNAQ